MCSFTVFTCGAKSDGSEVCHFYDIFPFLYAFYIADS